MTRSVFHRSPPRRHLNLARTLDLLEDRLPRAAAREVEEHLAAPCPACREQVRRTGLLLERMREDRVPPVPAAARERALGAFISPPDRSRGRGLAARIAALVFDSLAMPMPAAARRAVGEVRRLRFRLGEGTLELELESEGAGARALRGRLEVEEPALHRVEVASGGESRIAWPDAAGRFAVEGLAPGRLRLEVSGPAGRFRIPSFTA